MPRAMTPGSLVKAALGADLFPAGARSSGRGWATWEIGELEYRFVVDRADERTRWRVFVGDARLGPAFEDYGGLSVPIDPVSSGPEWPSGAQLRAEAAAALREFCRDGQSFAGSRRELAQLMLSPEDV